MSSKLTTSELRLDNKVLFCKDYVEQYEFEDCNYTYFHSKIFGANRELLGFMTATEESDKIVLIAIENLSKIKRIGTFFIERLQTLNKKIILSSKKGAVGFYWGRGFVFDADAIGNKKIYGEMTLRMHELFKVKVPGKRIETFKDFSVFAQRANLILIPMYFPVFEDNSCV